MFVSAHWDFEGLSVLLLEPEEIDAAELTAAVISSGGTVAGCVSSGMAAVSIIQHTKIHCVLVHVDNLAAIPFSLPAIMASFGVEVVPYSSTEDGWEEEDDVEAETETAPTHMPSIVVRTSIKAEERRQSYPDPRVMMISSRRPWPALL